MELQFVSAALAMVYFYPALVRGLGYSNPITAQYMTVSFHFYRNLICDT